MCDSEKYRFSFLFLIFIFNNAYVSIFLFFRFLLNSASSNLQSPFFLTPIHRREMISFYFIVFNYKKTYKDKLMTFFLQVDMEAVEVTEVAPAIMVVEATEEEVALEVMEGEAVLEDTVVEVVLEGATVVDS